MYEEISNIEDLVALMAKEAIKWKRKDYDKPFVNAAGIEAQWKEHLERNNFPNNFPCTVLALIWNDEGEDGGSFALRAFWFDENGKRIKRRE